MKTEAKLIAFLCVKRALFDTGRNRIPHTNQIKLSIGDANRNVNLNLLSRPFRLGPDVRHARPARPTPESKMHRFPSPPLGSRLILLPSIPQTERKIGKGKPLRYLNHLEYKCQYKFRLIVIHLYKAKKCLG